MVTPLRKCIYESPKCRVMLLRMTPKDMDHVLSVQRRCYPEDLIESADSFVEKVRNFPNLCFLCVQYPVSAEESGIGTASNDRLSTSVESESGVPVGYLVSILTKRFALPALNSAVVPQGATAPDTLYIHDVAVAPEGRGKGIAAALLQHAYEEAARHAQVRRTALIAVRGASAYWSRHAFEPLLPHSLPPAMSAKLQDYGDDAVYMEAPLSKL